MQQCRAIDRATKSQNMENNLHLKRKAKVCDVFRAGYLKDTERFTED